MINGPSTLLAEPSITMEPFHGSVIAGAQTFSAHSDVAYTSDRFDRINLSYTIANRL